ncbi:peroxidase 7 [Diospyros lotus]|uniref:peroxidase 7 n=1 Tax=Diospyros lotus TaxID=55363 RepID=UPI0022519245|nr:peroxidase 7 [Diospyros lotus]
MNSSGTILLLNILLIPMLSAASYQHGQFNSKDLDHNLPDLDNDGGLSSSYYHRTCPDAEAIINRKVKQWVQKDSTLAPSLIRLHFHDCSIRGCDGSVLLDYDGSERRANASKTLRGFQVIDDIKQEIENKCPKTVSCADILTAAARDATVEAGGPYWPVDFGRKDGRVSVAQEAEAVPMGREKITDLVEFFQSKGLNVLDLVVLSGMHTIGRSSCEMLQHRLYDFEGTGKPDPSINAGYLNFLRRKCRWASEYVHLDANTPNTFDTAYYTNLEKKMGLLSTDQLLFSDSRTRPLVSTMACQPQLFYRQMAVSMAKLGNILELTDEEEDEGEVRVNCNRANP